jgi:hypothetical protein
MSLTALALAILLSPPLEPTFVEPVAQADAPDLNRKMRGGGYAFVTSGFGAPGELRLIRQASVAKRLELRLGPPLVLERGHGSQPLKAWIWRDRQQPARGIMVRLESPDVVEVRLWCYVNLTGGCKPPPEVEREFKGFIESLVQQKD